MAKKNFYILPTIVIVLVVIVTVCFVTIPRRSSIVSNSNSVPRAESTLVMVHVLHRHGNRVPNNPAYSKNPINSESYYPEGYGQLSEAGKKLGYRLGTTLHQRYNWFLGPIWNYNSIEARSTNVSRTKMALQLILAGLWPPTGFQVIDPSLNWQPIPLNLVAGDKELDADKNCKNFDTLKKAVENSPEIRQAMSVYDQYYGYFCNMTGDNITSARQVFDIAMDQIAQEAYGYPLEDWVIKMFPLIEKMAKDLYYLETNTAELKQLTAGYLVKKMIKDSQGKLNGTVKQQAKKMFVYSAHEKNIAYFLRTLDIYDDKIPPYSTHILVELHLVDGVYGFKVYHQDWSYPAPRLQTIPGCRAFCPFEEFVSLTQAIIPEDDFCVTS